MEEALREHKWAILCSTKEKLTQRVTQTTPPFSFSIYGSSVYGVNGNIKLGKQNLCDMDTLAFLPQPISYQKLEQSMWELFDTPIVPSEEAYVDFLQGELGILRLGGSMDQLPVGIHMFNERTMRRGMGVTAIGRPLVNKLPFNRKYLDRTYNEQSVGSGKKKAFDPDVASMDGKSILLNEYFSRHTDSEPTVGVLADKLLISELIYESENSEARRLQEHLWRTFVRSNIFYNPTITNDDMLRQFVRYERFSPDFVKKLHAVINKERVRLTSQINLARLM